MQPTENAGSAVRPYLVTVAVRAIWATNAISALLMVANYDGSDASVNTLLVNAIFLLIYVLVTAKVGVGCHWARPAYAVLIAMEFALLAAFGLDQGSELDVLATYLTMPLELWILFKLFGAESDAWFCTQK